MKNFFFIIFDNKKYPLVFSFFYAWYLGFFFYPGLLYSDSVIRWRTAIDFANGGFASLLNHSDHHPVLPTIIMGLIYKVTGEIGAFSFLQIFIFALVSFAFVGCLSSRKYANFFVSLILCLPLFQVYSIFISYDTLFGIFLIFLSVCFIDRSVTKLFFLPFLFAFLVGVRLNFILLLPFVIFLIFLIYKNYSFKLRFLCSFLVVVLSVFVISIPSLLNMKKGNSFLIGTAWEYANLAVKTGDEKYISYIRSKGGAVDEIKANICYRGIWCGSENKEFISKIRADDAKYLFGLYLNLAVDYPLVFISEKIKYTKSLMGIGSQTLHNAEIARWRNAHWKTPMEELGFYSNERREKFIENYFNKSQGYLEFLFRPWVVILLIIAIAFVNSYRYNINYIWLSFLPIFYYSTFILTSQNHEMRYFFPVAFFFVLTASALFANILNSIEMLINKYVQRNKSLKNVP